MLALLVAAPAAAAPRWSEPADVAPSGGWSPRAVMDAEGNTLVTWVQRDSGGGFASAYRWWQPDSGWGEIRQLPQGRGGVEDVEITPHGEATVLIVAGESGRPNRLTVASAEPGGAIGDFETVTTDAMSPSNPGFGLGADDAGGVVLAWRKWRDPYSSDPQPGFVATRRPGGSFGDPQQVGHFWSGPLAIAVNAAGAGAVAWGDMATRNTGSPGWTGTAGTNVTYRAPGGSFGAPEPYGQAHNGSSVHLGIDVAGRVVVTSESAGLNPGPESRARYAVRSPLGEWTGSRVLDAEGSVTDLFVEPRGAVSFLINRRSDSGYENEARFLTLESDGRLEGGSLSSGRSRGEPAGAMNLRGGILAAWKRPAGDGEATQVVARERGFAGGPFAPEVVLADSYGGSLETATNDLGQAVVVWMDGGPDRQQLGQGPLRATVRDDPAVRAVPPPPDADIYSDPLATLDSDGDLLAPARCSVSCKVKASGIVFPGGEAKALLGRGKSKRLKARRRTKVKLDFGRAGRKAVKAALANGHRPWVSVSVHARGKSPRPFVVSRRFKIRR